jgi:hypothetical protein
MRMKVVLRKQQQLKQVLRKDGNGSEQGSVCQDESVNRYQSESNYHLGMNTVSK